MKLNNRSYFFKIKKEYLEAAEYNAELYQNMAVRLNVILFGRVVDFGNGGIVNYDTNQLEKLICVDIINESRVLTEAKIDFIHGDFYDIAFEGKADCLLAQFLFHHLTDDRRLEVALRQARNKLNEGGKLVVGEVVIPRIIESMQNMLKPIMFSVLKALNKPALRFFSIQSLTSLLSNQGFDAIQVETVPIGKRVRPAPVLFPKLKMPGRLYPLRCILIQASRSH